MNGVLAQHSEYVAPIGAKSSFSLWFYKEAAPTALRAKLGGRLGAAAQRRRRGISEEPRGPEIQSPSGAAYSEHQHNVLLINDLRLTQAPFEAVPTPQSGRAVPALAGHQASGRPPPPGPLRHGQAAGRGRRSCHAAAIPRFLKGFGGWNRHIS